MANAKIALGLVKANYAKPGWIGTTTETGSKTNVAVGTDIKGGDITTDPRVLPISVTGTLRTLVDSYSYAGGLGTRGAGLYGVYDPSNSSWGSPVAKAESNPVTPDPDIQDWSVTNPYGIVVIGTTMYMIDNDCDTTDRKARIYSYNMANDAYSENTSAVYAFDPAVSGDPTLWKAAGTGLEFYSNRGNFLIATFYRYTNEDWSYVFGTSAIVKINVSSGAATMAAANANATGVVVDGNYAYVTSVGGAQTGGGNADSKLEVFDISAAALSTPVATLAASLIPESFGGDYVDVAFVNSKAYVLAAHYDAAYTKYDYIIIQTTADDLQDGGFGTGVKYATGTISPASPCVALLPGGTNSLFFVNGVEVYAIDTSVDIDDSEALDPLHTAADFTFTDGDKAALINSAAVVVEKTVAARGLEAAVHVSVTKMAKRLVRPEDLERKEK